MKTKFFACLIVLGVLTGLLSSCGIGDLLSGTLGEALESYEVEFEVDGNVYATETVFVNAVSTGLPATPYKEGYTFSGWYFDEGTWDKPLNSENMKEQPIGTVLRVYAKWDGGGTSALPVPSGLRIVNDVLYWSAVPGASEYRILIGEESYVTDKTAIDLNGKVNTGSVLIFVQAISANEKISSSKWSSGISYTCQEEDGVQGGGTNEQTPPLSAPSGLSIVDNILSWSPVLGAAEYRIQIGDEIYTTDKTAISLVGKTSASSVLIFVQAVSASDSATDSGWSSGINYSPEAEEDGDSSEEELAVLSTPTGISVVDDIIRWVPVVGASEYNVQIGGEFYTTDKTAMDLTDKVTEGGVLIFVQAISHDDSFANSAWSTGIYYNVDTEDNQEDHIASSYGVGYGYNIFASPYYNAREVKSNSPLDVSKLAKFIKSATYSESRATSASGESVEEYMSSYSDAIGLSTKIGAGIPVTIPFTASVELNFKESFSRRQEDHMYQAFFTYFHHIDQNAYIVKDCSPQSYRSMLSEDFLAQINRETYETRNLSVEELADWLITRYGTHIVTGVSLGGRIEYSYYLSAKTNEICRDALSAVETAASLGFGNLLSITASLNNEFNSSQALTGKSLLIEKEVHAYGGRSGLINENTFVLGEENGGIESNEPYSQWIDSLETTPNAVRLTNDSLLALHILIPEDEKYDELRDAIVAAYEEAERAAYERILEEYCIDEETCTVDLSGLYAFGESERSVAGFSDAEFSHPFYDKNTGIFSVKGAYDGKNLSRYVFKGLYEKQDKNGDTCNTVLTDFTIQIDAENDIEIVLENFSIRGASGLPAIRLNPTKTQNITVTLTVNGESILMGGNGAAGTSASPNGRDGAAAIDLSSATSASLEIQGEHSLTVTGGNGGNGTVGGNGATGGAAVVVDNFVVNISRELSLIGGEGGNGAVGVQGKVATSYGENGGKGGNGGNGGDGAVPLECNAINLINCGSCVFVCGDGGNGGDGGAGTDGYKGWITLATKDWHNGGIGGNGGTGGNGGDAGYSTKLLELLKSTPISLELGDGGDGGKGGQGGKGGDGGDEDATPYIADPAGNNGGKGGQGGKGGDGGNGRVAGAGGEAGESGNGGRGTRVKWFLGDYTRGADGKKPENLGDGKDGEIQQLP